MASKTGGWAGKLLCVDLSTGRIWTEPSVEYGRKYIGGRGIAARITWDEIPKGVGPFNPENRIENWVNPVLGESVGVDLEKFGRLLDEYYTLRGWDVATGRPTAAKLRELGLADVAEGLTRLGLAPESQPVAARCVLRESQPAQQMKAG